MKQKKVSEKFCSGNFEKFFSEIFLRGEDLEVLKMSCKQAVTCFTWNVHLEPLNGTYLRFVILPFPLERSDVWYECKHYN